jgi:hypothetical protein
VSPSDPTDHALAAIASIRDQPEAYRTPEPAPADEEKPLAPANTEPFIFESAVSEPAVVEPNGYSKTGPGPMAAIRFKWTVRGEDNGAYYVDETIGENSAPITVGPMSADAAIKLVDDRESEAQRQFESLKREMTGRGTAVNPVRNDSGEM